MSTNCASIGKLLLNDSIKIPSITTSPFNRMPSSIISRNVYLTTSERSYGLKPGQIYNREIKQAKLEIKL